MQTLLYSNFFLMSQSLFYISGKLEGTNHTGQMEFTTQRLCGAPVPILIEIEPVFL